MEEGNFELVYDNSISEAGVHIQYLFTVEGLNINTKPEFDSQYDDSGSIIVTGATLSTEDELLQNRITVFPNPSDNQWHLNSSLTLNKLMVFDKQVMAISPKSNKVSIDNSNLSKGIYVVRNISDFGQTTKKLIKN